MESSSDYEIVGVVKNTPPINQRMGTFIITLPYFVLDRGTQGIIKNPTPFKASSSNVIQTMSTEMWNMVSIKGATAVKLIIYPDLERGTLCAGWKKFLKMNKFKGGDIVTFVVPEKLISEGKNGFMWVAKEGSMALEALADLFA